MVLRCLPATRGQGESNIRRWIIENDWLETIVALPLNLLQHWHCDLHLGSHQSEVQNA